MNSDTRPVVIAAGGTGGHVFPALAVAEVLGQRGVPVVWVGTKRGLESRLVPEAGIPIEWISVAGLRGKGILGRIVGPFQLIGAVAQSIWIISKLKPRAVLGMGGFVTGPVGVAAKLRGINLVLHEQNAVAGFTNKLLSRFANTVFTAVPNAFASSVNAITVGNPLRSEIEQFGVSKKDVLSTYASDVNKHNGAKTSDELNVLIVGGSQGAQVLNKVLPDVVKQLEFSIKVVHQTGLSMYESVQDRYASPAESKHEIDVQKFIENITAAYEWADLVVCRSGAMTVSELAAMSKPSVLVPYPFAVDDHQTHNAKFLEQAGAAVLIPQPEFTVATLTELLTHLHEDREKLMQMGNAANACFHPAAAKKVANALAGNQDEVISDDYEVSA